MDPCRERGACVVLGLPLKDRLHKGGSGLVSAGRPHDEREEEDVRRAARARWVVSAEPRYLRHPQNWQGALFYPDETSEAREATVAFPHCYEPIRVKLEEPRDLVDFFRAIALLTEVVA